MNRIVSHLLLPALLPVLFFVVAFTPVEVLGCRNRGLLALLIAGVSGAGALGAAVAGAKGRARRDPTAVWWTIRTLILTIPVVALIVLA